MYTCKFSCMLEFRLLRYCCSEEEAEEEEDEEHGNSVKISITCITPVLQAILDFSPDIISFQHVFHLGVGRSQIEWKLKVKTQISVFPWAKIGQNDHSNPYIESTTVLSDIYIYIHCMKPPNIKAPKCTLYSFIFQGQRSQGLDGLATAHCEYRWGQLTSESPFRIIESG